ncbi:MAG: hypothetical protein ACD_16C00059G0008 [uncultured bacterium]|nr:MAG: hypothetical protein ACD_16C00059G0008 [uncultured bacterium]OFW69724.1 MAG: hypothetical protein A2X70_01540 [Alphaproteobacteria bacterium GWC2_42_16]OFW74307.1 MAG: hypothetical protein A2Z80_04325 [Alphaproteobacteria bacterium GWA2_41_27]OFW84533.1 MAG: hypothetical protein A3E50_07785 [Alphaproteobacteria bacterium RIFCSPHIGHO2_12_FULL_42_100]OFW85510.1 MAG: hypothetical protein A2W06_01995 [Alphaproteobacteria bacterium RBG_16_42_14]OFW91363.1 MAG: hypothetical protein A2W46_027
MFNKFLLMSCSFLFLVYGARAMEAGEDRDRAGARAAAPEIDPRSDSSAGKRKREGAVSEGTGLFSGLPLEIVVNGIMGYLDPPRIIILGRTNKAFYNLTNDPYVWGTVTRRDSCLSGLLAENNCTKKVVINAFLILNLIKESFVYTDEIASRLFNIFRSNLGLSALNGDASYQYALGKILLEEKDKKFAPAVFPPAKLIGAFFLHLASEQGHILAQYELGMAYGDPNFKIRMTDSEKRDQALSLFLKAGINAPNGDPTALGIDVPKAIEKYCTHWGSVSPLFYYDKPYNPYKHPSNPYYDPDEIINTREMKETVTQIKERYQKTMLERITSPGSTHYINCSNLISFCGKLLDASTFLEEIGPGFAIPVECTYLDSSTLPPLPPIPSSPPPPVERRHIPLLSPDALLSEPNRIFPPILPSTIYTCLPPVADEPKPEKNKFPKDYQPKDSWQRAVFVGDEPPSAEIKCHRVDDPRPHNPPKIYHYWNINLGKNKNVEICNDFINNIKRSVDVLLNELPKSISTLEEFYRGILIHEEQAIVGRRLMCESEEGMIKEASLKFEKLASAINEEIRLFESEKLKLVMCAKQVSKFLKSNAEIRMKAFMRAYPQLFPPRYRTASPLVGGAGGRY